MAKTKEAQPNKTKDKGSLYLEVKLTEKELKDASKLLAESIQKKQAVEARLESVRAQGKAEIAEQDAIIQKASALVNNEKEFRTVPCEIVFDWDSGEKTYFSIDTGKELKKERITEGERQMHFA